MPCQIRALKERGQVSAWNAPLAGLILGVENWGGDAIQAFVHATESCEGMLLFHMQHDLCQ